MAETKKKATTKAKATPKTKVKVEKVAESKVETTSVNKTTEEKPMTLNDIPQELLAQIIAMAQSQMQPTTNKVEEKVVKPTRYTKAYLNEIKREVIEVKSLYNGHLTFKSQKTGMEYTWLEYGATELLSIEEILAMENNKRFLHTPWLVIEDERVIQALGLERLYQDIKLVGDIDTLLNSNIDEIEEVVNRLPNEFKQELTSLIYSQAQNGQIRDVILLRELGRILNCNFIN